MAEQTDFRTEACASMPDSCLADCQSGRATACYALALRLQKLEVDDALVGALFLRACRLGVMSGCTNRAASILRFEGKQPEKLACATRTFERMCIRDDPWACTMFGSLLYDGRGVARDHDRALTVLSKSCKYGVEDPACTSALQLIQAIRATRAPAEDPAE